MEMEHIWVASEDSLVNENYNSTSIYKVAVSN